MRLKTPRLAPLSDAELSPEAAATLAPYTARGTDYAIFRTLAHHPKGLARFSDWGRFILSENSLPKRAREIAILRTGWHCKAGYEWAQHVEIGKRAGLSDEDIARLKKGSEAGWSEAEAALLAACDDLFARQCISDAVWTRIHAHYSKEQIIDLIFTVGQYTMVSMALNSLGVQLDSWLKPDPDLESAP